MPTSKFEQFKIEVHRKPAELDTVNYANPFELPTFKTAILQTVKIKAATFICVENGESFIISVSKISKDEQTYYGAVLYLDGLRVPGCKIF